MRDFHKVDGSAASEANEEISADFINAVCRLLANDKRTVRSLPDGGRLNFDRLLPFMCVYRRNPERVDSGTRVFVNGEAAYLNAPGDAPIRKGLRRLVQRIAETASNRFGGFLIVEIWSAPDSEVPDETDSKTGETILPGPAFRIVERTSNRPEETVNTLRFALEHIKLYRRDAEITVESKNSVHPPGMSTLLTESQAGELNCFMLGLELRPVYRDGENGDTFPAILRQLRRGVAQALRKAFFAFALEHTTVRPHHFYELGRRTVAKPVWEIERQLADIDSRFDFLLQVTPINAESSWGEFQENGFQKQPAFYYRPLNVDPLLLKRDLNLVATERIVDATMAHLLRQTQDELDRQVTMLSDLGTNRFLHGSIQIYGSVDASLLKLARRLLKRFPSSDHSYKSEEQIDAKAFASRAAKEFRYYRRQDKRFAAEVHVRDDMYSGLMVSGGQLLIGRETTFPEHRAEALLQHEVGTHLVTYYNGLAQRMRLLATGLPGYDGMQEGLAVLAEYLVGGLSRGRLRMLAARVVAAHQMIQGSCFTDTFETLVDVHKFDPHTAFTITLRVFRGGGLTKDIVYLRGLVEVLDYLRRGGDLQSLFVGKLAVDHVPIVRELLLRGVLCDPPLQPRYMSDPAVADKLEELRTGVSVLDLIEADG